MTHPVGFSLFTQGASELSSIILWVLVTCGDTVLGIHGVEASNVDLTFSPYHLTRVDDLPLQ